MVKVERDKEMPQASFVSLELRTTNKKTAQNKRCNIRKDGKGILLRFFVYSGIDCTAASSRSLSSFSLTVLRSIPWCIKGAREIFRKHFHYRPLWEYTRVDKSFCTRAKWIAQEGSWIYSIASESFFSFFLTLREILQYFY